MVGVCERFSFTLTGILDRGPAASWRFAGAEVLLGGRVSLMTALRFDLWVMFASFGASTFRFDSEAISRVRLLAWTGVSTESSLGISNISLAFARSRFMVSVVFAVSV